MSRPRCGVPDKPPMSPGDGGAGPFVAASTKWSNVHLGYHLSKGTPHQSDASVNGALSIAYRKWCLEAKIEVHQVSSAADIDVRFGTGDHGDGSAFDGVGTILAHGFYPPRTVGPSPAICTSTTRDLDPR